MEFNIMVFTVLLHYVTLLWEFTYIITFTLANAKSLAPKWVKTSR